MSGYYDSLCQGIAEEIVESLIEYNVIHARSFCPIIDVFLGHIILIIVPNGLARIDGIYAAQIKVTGCLVFSLQVSGKRIYR